MEQIDSHRSIRKYSSQKISKEVIMKCVEAASRGSNTGNMQLYSIVVSQDPAIKEQLAPLHFNQPCAKGADAIITFCVDINRFSLWCEERNAEPSYDNFQWFLTGVVDTTIAAQNFAIEAENQGLGLCYLGTTTYNALEIAAVLNLPKGVLPITTLTLGYPDENPPLTDRLPLEAIVHFETYQDYSPEKIDELWSEKETLDFTKELLEANGCETLAQVFTQKRYPKQNNLLFSEKVLKAIIEQGFL